MKHLSQHKPIYEWVKDIHETAKQKGWWEANDLFKIKRPLEIHALIVSEVAEAMEEYRKGMPPIYSHNEEVATMVNGSVTKSILPGKPEGELIELADAVIRIMDYCGYMGWDLEQAMKMKHDYNTTRGFRHGNKLA